MRRLHRWLPGWVAVAAVAAGLLAMPPTPTDASHSWGGYHWASTTNAEFTLQLGNNVSGVWSPYLGVASGDWSRSTALNTTIVAGATSGRRCRAATGRVEVCDASYGSTGWLGLAQIWVSGGHITAGTTKMNDTYYSSGTYNTPAWRQFVMCQEVGHTFGLAHQDESFTNANLGSCMDYTNSPGTNQHPNQHDYDQLVTIYGSGSHLDSTTTVGAASAPGRAPATGSPFGQPPAPGSPFGDEGPDNPEDFGRPLGPRDEHGRAIYFERDLGGGRRLLTHVYWVGPQERGHERAR